MGALQVSLEVTIDLFPGLKLVVGRPLVTGFFVDDGVIGREDPEVAIRENRLVDLTNHKVDLVNSKPVDELHGLGLVIVVHLILLGCRLRRLCLGVSVLRRLLCRGYFLEILISEAHLL
jgi:hypothetical protein